MENGKIHFACRGSKRFWSETEIVFPSNLFVMTTEAKNIQAQLNTGNGEKRLECFGHAVMGCELLPLTRAVPLREDEGDPAHGPCSTHRGTTPRTVRSVWAVWGRCCAGRKVAPREKLNSPWGLL